MCAIKWREVFRESRDQQKADIRTRQFECSSHLWRTEPSFEWISVVMSAQSSILGRHAHGALITPPASAPAA